MELNSPENPAEQFLFNPFPNDKFFYSSKLKKFADDNFKFDQNGEVLKMGRKLGKGEIARDEQFLLFQQHFQKTFSAGT